jgi:hypothetical protein
MNAASDKKLTRRALVDGLLYFPGDRYLSLNVFAVDLAEETALDHDFFDNSARGFNLRISPTLGVARLMRGLGSSPMSPAHRPWVEVEKGEGGMLLGLLVGRRLPQLADAPSPQLSDQDTRGTYPGYERMKDRERRENDEPGRHVCTLQWSVFLSRWRPYGGGLVSWMKDRLAPPFLDDVDAAVAAGA